MEKENSMTECKYIRITDKKRCSGCTACQSVCPQGCISMQEDEEGFLYPVVDDAVCIQCGKCVKVCPYSHSEFTNKPDGEELALCYAAYNKDEKVRYQSSSGGMFRAFADKIISEGGVVFGAAFDKDFLVEHTYAETLDELRPLMGSKYLQSRIGGSFGEVKRFLKEGRKVLFTGCGCQIAGLKRFLNHDDRNLICVDLICQGIDSPRIWKSYLHSLFSDDRVEYINFRDKKTGQNNSSVFIKGSKSTFCERKRNFLYFRSWRYKLFTRPSCEVCPFKRDNRVSDITISDCWGFQKIAPELYDDKGLSSVIIHTDKGKSLFDAVVPQLVFKETLLEDVKQYNWNYIRSAPFNAAKRNAFWKDYRKGEIPFGRLLTKHLRESKRQRTARFVKRGIKKCLSLLGLRKS